MVAVLETCWNEIWGWRKISNQIWPLWKEMCVRALYCFGDGKICPRKHCLGANKLSPYLHAQVTAFDGWGPHMHCSVSALCWHSKVKHVKKWNFEKLLLFNKLGVGLYNSKYLNVFPGKKSKLSRDDNRERKRVGDVREVRHPGTALQSSTLIQNCLWLWPYNSIKAGSSTSWKRRNMPGLAMLLPNYWTQEQQR